MPWCARRALRCCWFVQSICGRWMPPHHLLRARIQTPSDDPRRFLNPEQAARWPEAHPNQLHTRTCWRCRKGYNGGALRRGRQHYMLRQASHQAKGLAGILRHRSCMRVISAFIAFSQIMITEPYCFTDYAHRYTSIHIPPTHKILP